MNCIELPFDDGGRLGLIQLELRCGGDTDGAARAGAEGVTMKLSEYTDGEIVVAVLIFIGLALLVPYVFMYAWSLFAPSMFGLPYLTWTEAAGIMLFTILFRGLGRSSK